VDARLRADDSLLSGFQTALGGDLQHLAAFEHEGTGHRYGVDPVAVLTLHLESADLVLLQQGEIPQSLCAPTPWSAVSAARGG